MRPSRIIKPGNNPDIDWDTFINDYHELIDRYRGDT